MNVDTSEFRALTGQVASLSRKVSTLSGRVTVMGHQANRIDQAIDNDLRRLTDVLLMVAAPPWRPRPRPQPRHARPRHLHLVRSDQP